MMTAVEVAMEVNEYALDLLVRQRLHDARAIAAQRILARRRRSSRPSVRARVGAVLIALGERVLGASPGRVARGASHG